MIVMLVEKGMEATGFVAGNQKHLKSSGTHSNGKHVEGAVCS